MEDKELSFDREKHICYSAPLKKTVKEHLLLHHDAEEAERRWEKIQLKYAEFLSDLPYQGGKACRHNGAGGTYDSIALLAYYEIEKAETDLKEINDMCNYLLLLPYAKLGRVFNLNNPLLQRIMHLAFVMTARADKKLQKSCPTGFVTYVEPYDKKIGNRFGFTRCPVAEFAKAHGYEHVMPALCNSDYPAMEAINASLIRRGNCVEGNKCDYWIVGSKSQHAAEHPKFTDAKGYIKNK